MMPSALTHFCRSVRSELFPSDQTKRADAAGTGAQDGPLGFTMLPKYPRRAEGFWGPPNPRPSAAGARG